MIKDMLLKNKTVKVADLVKVFDVSEETIRRDLNFLEQEGFLKKSYGGAILHEDIEDEEERPPVEQRQSQHYEEKDVIGKRALDIVNEKQIVILDAGTTTWCVASHLKGLKAMTFVTNGLNIAEECSKGEDSTVFLIGGKLIKRSMSLVGPQAMNELKKYNANVIFLGATGVSLEKGFFSSDIYEAEVKRAMVHAGRKVVIVIDHSKFGKQGLVSFAGFEDVDIIITGDKVDEEIISNIEEKGVEVLICKTGEEKNNRPESEKG